MSDKFAPRISVIVPVFNGERFLSATLESILAQQVPGVEIIVIDDGSQDGTAAILKNYHEAGTIRYLQQENAGPSVARNNGLALASPDAPYLAFLDADDFWPAGALRCQLEEMEQSSWQILLGKTQCFYSNDTAPPQGNLSPPFHVFQLGSALYRREVFAKVRSFNPALRFGEDADWFMRAREAGIAVGLSENISLFYRRHPESMTSNRTIGLHGLLSSLHGSLRRRREKGNGTAFDLEALDSALQKIDRVEDRK